MYFYIINHQHMSVSPKTNLENVIKCLNVFIFMVFFLISRLACANDHEMTSFLIKSETRLFYLRFACMTSAELVSLLRSTYRFVHHLVRRNKCSRGMVNNQEDIIKSAKDLYLVLGSTRENNKRTFKMVVEQYVTDSYTDTINVPFQYALALVRYREVSLNKGIAYVPCAKLHQILASLFEQIVVDGMKRAKQMYRTICEDDHRMVDLFRELRHVYYSGRRISSSMPYKDLEAIRCNDVDHLSEGFPPCMQHLHKMLRQKHRLRHFSRVGGSSMFFETVMAKSGG